MKRGYDCGDDDDDHDETTRPILFPRDLFPMLLQAAARPPVWKLTYYPRPPTPGYPLYAYMWAAHGLRTRHVESESRETLDRELYVARHDSDGKVVKWIENVYYWGVYQNVQRLNYAGNFNPIPYNVVELSDFSSALDRVVEPLEITRLVESTVEK